MKTSAVLLAVTAAVAGCGGLLPTDWDTVPVVPDAYNAYLCSCDCRNTAVPVVPPHSLIAASPDDAARVQNPVRTVLDGRTLSLGTDRNGNATTIGLRFTALGIPPKSHIVSANIQFTASDASVAGAGATLSIDALLLANVTPFTTSTDLSTLSPLTGNPVQWQPGDWIADEASSPEATPDLAALVQAIVNLPGYSPTSAIGFIIAGSGRRTAVSFDGSDVLGAVRTQAPKLTFQFEEPEHSQDFLVCGDPAQAQADCSGRVQTTVQALANECSLSSECTCTYEAANGGKDPKTFSKVCNDSCVLVARPADCNPEEFAKATATANTQPVCLGHSPLGSSLFGHRSVCDVDESQSTITIRFVDDDGDSETKTEQARGRIEFVGTPCPGSSCDVGMTHRLHMNDVTIENFFGDNTFSELSAVGESLPTSKASLDTTGTGAFGFGSTVNSARGHHNEEDQTSAVLASNSDPIGVGIGGWQSGGVCTLEGNLVGTANPRNVCSEGPEAGKTCASAAECGNCGDDPCPCLPLSGNVTMTASVRGTLVNQPPTAVAGQDQTVECNETGRATFILDATQSGDPDNNVSRFAWFRGGRTGDLVGAQPRIVLEQDVDDTTAYVFKVIDAFGQYDESTTHVSVVDSKPPEIFCNAPATITPPRAPVSFTATAEDVCDASVVPAITGYFCYKIGKNRVVSKLESCVVSFTGDTVTIVNSGGVDARIQWTVSAADDSGNSASRTCEIMVVQKK